MPDIARGRKEIAKALDVSWDTVKRWQHKHHLPVRYFPNGKPFLIISEFKTWAITFDENMKKSA